MGSLLSCVHLSLICSFEPIGSCGQNRQRVIWSHCFKKKIFFEHAEASTPDSKLSLIAFSHSDSKLSLIASSPPDSKLSITLMIDACCSGLISFNKPSVTQYAKRRCLSDVKVLSIGFDSNVVNLSLYVQR